MSYNGLTNKGLEYLTKCQAESKAPVFTKVKIGSGSIPGGKTGESTTELYHFEKEAGIISSSQEKNRLKLTIQIDNRDIEVGFYIKEIGVYAQDGDEEVLYWYINRDRPSPMPDKSEPATQTYLLGMEVSQAAAIVIEYTGNDLLATKEYVDSKIKDCESRIELIEKSLGLEFREDTLGNGYLGALYLG